MHAWQIPYLGWQKLPADLSAFEIEHFFTLKVEERRAVRWRYKSVLRLGAALQIGFLKMCGRPLDAVQRVPAPLLKHLGEQLAVPSPDLATLRGLYSRRRRTLHEHQAWAIEFLGMTRFEVTDTDRVLAALTGLVRAGLSGDQLLAAARRTLFERRFPIPGPRRVGTLVRAAVVATDQEALAAIERDIPVEVRTRWLTEIARPFGGRATLHGGGVPFVRGVALFLPRRRNFARNSLIKRECNADGRFTTTRRTCLAQVHEIARLNCYNRYSLQRKYATPQLGSSNEAAGMMHRCPRSQGIRYDALSVSSSKRALKVE